MRFKIFLAAIYCPIVVVMIRQFFFIASRDETINRALPAPAGKPPRIESEERPIFVKVRVEEAGSCAPVPNAKVELHWSRKGFRFPGGRFKGKTNEHGRFKCKTPVFDELRVDANVKFFTGPTTAEKGAYVKDHCPCERSLPRDEDGGNACV